MADYVTQAACRSVRPACTNHPNKVPRPHLVNKLLGERGVARFIVAGPGLGKSVLAADYAAIMFSFAHCFWFDAQSPCFLRELDDGLLCKHIRKVDPEVRLVVFDDVPQLSDERASELSKLIDALLELSVEVVVTLLPSNDAYAARQKDRITVRDNDLFLNESELSSLAFSRGFARVADLPRYMRLSCLAWGSDDDALAMLKRCASVEPSSLVACAACALLLCQRDSLTFVERAFGMHSHLRHDIAAAFPACGIDKHGRHESAPFRAEDIVRAFRPHLSNMVQPFESADEFLDTFTCSLLERKDVGRACELILQAGVATRAQWLLANELALVDSYAFVDAQRVSESVHGESSSVALSLRVQEAWRQVLAGAHADATEGARAVLASRVASPMARVTGALLLAVRGRPDDKKLALAELTQWGTVHGEMESPLRASSDDAYMMWKPLASIRCAIEENLENAYDIWKRWEQAGVDRCILSLCAGWLLGRALDEAETEHTRSEVTHIIEDLSAWILSCADATKTDNLGFFLFGAMRVYEQARKMVGLPEPSLAIIHRAQRSSQLMYQQQEALRALYQKQIPFEPQVLSAELNATLAQRFQPLRVSLFGGMHVHMGEEYIDFDACRRHKVKTLFALLVLQSGRELTREVLATDLWPNSDPHTAKKNFYTVWGQLKRLLMTIDESAPYVVRNHGSYRIDTRYIESDISRLDELCRHFLSARLEPVSWLHLLNEFEACYCGELFPSEQESAIIARARREQHNRAVAVLLAAAKRLMREGHAEAALQFAQAAYRKDHVHEDVYRTLMDVQLALGQRTSALDTYMTCRQYLASELGLDPAPELVNLYRAIIEEETELAV